MAVLPADVIETNHGAVLKAKTPRGKRQPGYALAGDCSRSRGLRAFQNRIANRTYFYTLQVGWDVEGKRMSTSTDKNSKSPLDAAQKIVTELKGMATDQQSLALKFAMETLGLQLPAVFALAPPNSADLHQSVPPPDLGGADQSTDIRSFTSIKAPKSDQQFTAVVAYFYQFEAKPGDRKEAIDADTMKEAARLAGRPQVARWNMTLTNAKNAGYLDSAGNGKFKLSSVGENLVAITLPGNAAPGGTNTNKKAKKTPSKQAAKKKR